MMLRNVLVACGRLSRHVGNVSNFTHEEGARTHGVTDVFVHDLGKWVMLDADHNVHYELDGVPLSPWEVGEEWFRNRGRDVDICVGLDRKKVASSGAGTLAGCHETSKALWNHHRWSTDPFTDHGTWFGNWNTQLVLVLVGKRHDGVLCYRGRAPNHEVDAGYSDGRIQYTTRAANVYPDVGTAHLDLKEGPFKGTVRVQVGTYTPNLEAVEVKVDERPWSDQRPEFLWYPHVGSNAIRVRTRDRFGNLGRESKVNVNLKEKKA